MTDSPSLGLPYLEAAQAQKHVTHNEALRRLDALVQAVVVDRTSTAPPGSPVEGASYIPATGASGAWTGHALEIAVWQDGAWVFFVPAEGWRVWSAAEDVLLAWTGTAWTIAGGASLLNPASLVGVNTTADTTNRLAVASAATLFNHAGAGHQLKLNKSAASDTASLLYQTAFSGRAEMGTTGDDDFHLKVSADGTTWNEAIVVNRSTGSVSFPHTTISGGVTDGDKGDIAVTASGATWTIDPDAVTNAKLANMATQTFKGRTTAGSGDPEDLSIAQVKTLLNLTGTNSGDQTITLTSDVTGSGTGSFAATIANNAVTNAKAADMAVSTIKGRVTAGTGDPEDLSVAQAKTLLNLTGTNSGDQTITLTGDVTGSGTASFAATIANDAVTYAKMQNASAGNVVLARAAATAGDYGEVALAASQLFGRGATGDLAAITLGTNLSMSGTTLNASGGGGGGLSDADYGDITVSGTGTVMTIDPDVVTNGKLANMATATFKGRATAGSGDPEDLTATQATALLDAFTSAAKGLAPASGGGTTNFLRADGTWAAPAGGGGGTPGGSSTQIQYNNSSTFGGAADLTYDSATGAVTFGKWAKLTDQASDPALPSGGINLFAKKLGGRRMPRFNTPLDFGSFLQPFLGTQKVGELRILGNSASTPVGLGIANPTLAGTGTSRAVATTNMLTRARRVGVLSAATAASTCSMRQAVAQWTVGNGSGLGGFFFSCIFNISDVSIVAGGRTFAGLSSTIGALTDVEPSTLLNCIGVGANAADTNLQIIYGGSTAQTRIDLGSSFPSDTTNTDLYRLCLFSSPSENGVVYYEVTRLNTGDVATGTLGPGTAGVTLPANTTLLTYQIHRSNGGVATAVGIDVSQIYIETDQ